MANKKPVDFHPDLTEARLIPLAELIFATRNASIDATADAERIPWAAGCLVYDRTRDAIIKKSSEWDWLSICDASMCFTFKIGAVPGRFYTGEPDEPTTRTLANHNTELDQLSLAFPDTNSPGELKWRFAVDHGIDGKTLLVSFVGLSSSGEVVCRWDYDRKRVVSMPVAPAPEAARKLAPPLIAVKAQESERKDEKK